MRAGGCDQQSRSIDVDWVVPDTRAGVVNRRLEGGIIGAAAARRWVELNQTRKRVRGKGILSELDDPFDLDSFSWPRKGARLFEAKVPLSPPAFLESGPSRWWMYAESYRFAAASLVAMFARTGHDQDFLALPVLFLYRHYVEIALKLIEHEASLLLGRPEPKPKGHGIRDRWGRVQPLLEDIWPNPRYEGENRNVRNLVAQLDIVDPDSDTFRYPVDPEGNSNLPQELQRLDLAHFATEMEAFAHWVGGVEGALSAEQDAANEMRQAELDAAPGPDDY
jgi:hypothetical protein